MFGIGAGELIIILIAGLIIFGPSKLPEVGRAIGKGLREFRKAQAAFSATLDEVETKKTSDEKKTAVNVNDVINMAKNKPLAKENTDEKVFDGNDTVNVDTNVSKRIEPARSGTDGVGK